MAAPRNWWEGNKFMRAQPAAAPRYKPLMALETAPAPIPLTAEEAMAYLQEPQENERSDYGSGESIPLTAENRFGELPMGQWGRAGLTAAGLAMPAIAPLTMAGGLLGGAANVMANNRARESIGAEGLDFGQALGGVLGFNAYGRGLDPTGETAVVADRAPGTPSGIYNDIVWNQPPAGADSPTEGQWTEPGPEWIPNAYDLAEDWGREGYRKGGATPDNRNGSLEPIPAVLHEGEFVIRPEAVTKYGRGLLAALNEGRVTPAKAKGMMAALGRKK